MKNYDYFLVSYDDKHGNMDTEGINVKGVTYYLNSNGFKCKAGFWGCSWYFVDIVNKTYKPGRPGVEYGTVVGNHAITFEEFKQIYEIYKKYRNLPILRMKKKNTLEVVKATYILSDGTLVTIPVENAKETLEKMEKNLEEYYRKHKK